MIDMQPTDLKSPSSRISQRDLLVRRALVFPERRTGALDEYGIAPRNAIAYETVTLYLLDSRIHSHNSTLESRRDWPSSRTQKC
jgi:hypothetical protein